MVVHTHHPTYAHTHTHTHAHSALPEAEMLTQAVSVLPVRVCLHATGVR